MADIGPMKTADNYRIMIYGPKEDGTYVVEFRTDGPSVRALNSENRNGRIRRFEERMPYGLVVPPPRRKLRKATQKISPAAAEPKRLALPPDRLYRRVTSRIVFLSHALSPKLSPAGVRPALISLE